MATQTRATRTPSKAAKKKPKKSTAKRGTAKKARVVDVDQRGSVSISREKYDLLSAAILAVVPRAGDGVPLKDLPALVEQRLSSKERSAIGSVSSQVTAVKLDLEARKRIECVAGSSPQRLRRVR